MKKMSIHMEITFQSDTEYWIVSGLSILYNCDLGRTLVNVVMAEHTITLVTLKSFKKHGESYFYYIM